MTSLFDGENTSWNVKNEYKVLPNDRTSNYFVVNELLKNIGLCEIIPDERIGSESTMGEVYRWNNIAVKIMPIINKGSYDNNDKECSLAIEVSNLVRKGISKYFPIVYANIFCESTFFYNHSNSLFAIKSKKYQEFDVIQSHLLLSELAYTDLKNYAPKFSTEELNEVILQVLKGIRDLQLHCNIVHNDLHLGNVLLLYNPKKYKIQILIHDFGRSIKVNKQFNFIQRKKDIIIFLASVRELKVPEINNKINEVINILDTSVSNFPILECIKYWKND